MIFDLEALKLLQNVKNTFGRVVIFCNAASFFLGEINNSFFIFKRLM